jgi:hypothetical protein
VSDDVTPRSRGAYYTDKRNGPRSDELGANVSVTVKAGADLQIGSPYVAASTVDGRPVQVPYVLRFAPYGTTAVSLSLQGGVADLQRLRDLCDRAIRDEPDPPDPRREDPAP